MTKLTQQQRREQKTQNNLNNRDVSEHNNYMSSNIKNIYPNVNVIFIILAYENVISNIKKLYGFAQGAVLAAEWLVGKKGIYTLDDILQF